MADSSKTEQPTQQRRKKAREKGQVARSRELPGALTIIVVLVWILSLNSVALFTWRGFYRSLLQQAALQELTLSPALLQKTIWVAAQWTVVPMLGAFAIATASTLLQGGFVFSSEALAWKPERLSPGHRLKQIFSAAGLSNTLKSLLPFAAILWLAVSQIRSEWVTFIRLGGLPVARIGSWLLAQCVALVWKCCLVLLLWSALDYLLQRQRLEGDLKMSREEIKQEFKESEGNPQVKAKIRRMQRQVRRQQMLHAVKAATVVVTNPTHYALALEYRPDFAAPVLVAKGLDRLAEEIKQVAIWHEIPLVENRALAHALYRSVEVGQAIPSKLFTAVAEVLAAVYRAQAQVKRD
ncbi:type III secretion exporter [Candidatus Koribacter versatilis Ellin345]|uniref:Type III secretion exporter n=1 Tax=Koribacter versatilis (strain Ellin345) TaxID=204669 RepID=Q1IR59_KORVE|nr:EscU/YscU/HrcU family type III secretion system export apparatus switch protein [Candidatus Koribacter versatilis]ABF40641.1 type III secretion exporter [Candidatus Koribacter versatilis Ellin345]